MAFDYMEKIGSLLRQAEGTDNEKEAHAFMQAAQRLATSNSISLELARQHQADKEKRESPIQERISIGERGRKGLKYYVQLFLAIAGENDVKCNIAVNSTYVIAFGFPSDIEMAKLLYASLIVQMVEASDKFLRSGEYKNERTGDWNWQTGKPRHVDGRVARANFQEAFVGRIRKRLFDARQEAIAEADANAEPVSAPEGDNRTGTEIVLANKAVEVTDFYKQTSDAVGNWGGYSGSKGYSGSARIAGANAGNSARLGEHREIGGGPRAIAASSR